MVWRLDIKDKVGVVVEEDNRLYCPAHCIPHRPPFTKPITDEPCHYHLSRWRMMHHIPYCFFLCPNYERMM